MFSFIALCLFCVDELFFLFLTLCITLDLYCLSWHSLFGHESSWWNTYPFKIIAFLRSPVLDPLFGPDPLEPEPLPNPF